MDKMTRKENRSTGHTEIYRSTEELFSFLNHFWADNRIKEPVVLSNKFGHYSNIYMSFIDSCSNPLSSAEASYSRAMGKIYPRRAEAGKRKN